MVNPKSLVKSSPAKSGKGKSPSISAADLKRMHRNMLLTRRLDDKMLILLKQGKSFFHIGASGHEAAQIALAANMRGGHDWAYPYYRGMSFCIEFGMTAKELLLCFLAKADDPNSGGRQMPSHFGHRELRIVSQSSPTGTQFLQAVGTGLAILREGSDEVVMVSAGEGTTSQGDFHEALNWAAREKAPVIFLIEDNNYAISVPIAQQTAGASVYDMCGGYAGLERVEVDGTDLFAAYEAAKAAVERARAGRGPTLIVADVVRLLPHSSSDNHAKYRSPDELEKDRQRDPIPRLEQQLVELGIYTQDEIEAIRLEVKSEVDEMAEEAALADYPDPATATDHVYSSRTYQAPEGAALEPKSTIADSIVLVDAVNHAMVEEMERNEKIVVYGEDVQDNKGGVFTATRGLTNKFGEARVFNSPLAESSIIGTAVGMAVKGWKPVVEIQFGDYVWTAMMQIRNEMAVMRYRSAGNWKCPFVARIPVGGYIHGALYHSQNIEATFAHFPGLYVAYPSNAADAKGLLKAAIRGDDPYLFLEHKGLYRQMFAATPEPDADFLLPWGRARVARSGQDMTVITWGALVKKSLDAAEKMSREHGVSVEVIDVRTMVPFDTETVLESVKKTGKALIAHEDVLFAGFGAEIAAQITDQAFEHLDGPVRRVAGANTPIPYNWHLEAEILPQDHHVYAAMVELSEY